MILSLRACLFLLIALFANYVFATTENVNWSVIKTEKDLVTSNEVKEYIDHMLITDGMHAHLFKSAQEDFSTYQQNRHEIIRDTFTPTIKRMAFIRLAQTIAIHQKDRQYFQLTQRDFNRLVDNKIKTILELQTTKENPAANPVDGLVNDLKLKGFPHQKSESNDEIYQRWVKRLKFKMREESREREALSFVCSVGDCDQESPLKILTQKKRFLDRAFLQLRLTPDSMVQGDEAFKLILAGESVFTKTEVNSTEGKKPDAKKEIILIGRVIDQKFEFMAVNDWDITSVLGNFGYPDTDDLGRTSGLMLNYILTGTKGSLAIELKNWLFTEELGEIDGYTQQNVEEEAILRIVSRHFLDDRGNRWLVLGVSGNKRVQEAAFHSWAQKLFHTLNPKTQYRENAARDGLETYLEGYIGLGGKYSILESTHVDIKITGETLAVPTVGTIDRSRFTVSSSLDINLHGQRRDYPFLYASLFGEYSLLMNGEHESLIGANAGVGFIIKNIYYQTNVFVMRWDTDLDRRYEGGPSWTTGVSLSLKFVNKPSKIDFVFN